MNTLLVCVDFSDKNEKLLSMAKKMASSFKERIILLHVCQPSPDCIPYEAGPAFYVQEQTEELLKTQAESLKKIASKLSGGGFNVQHISVLGIPAKEILEHAKKLHADMILMGTHGHGHLYNLLLGSVAEEILRKAPCPVLMMPMKE